MERFTTFFRLQTSVLKKALALCVLMLAAGTMNAQNTQTLYKSGTVADGEWFLYTDGTLKFSEFTWAIPDYRDVANAPWSTYSSKIKSIDFGSVQFVGNYAFDECENLQSITAPNVLSVGGYTFRNCHSLTKVYLPEATTVGEKAFVNCTALKSVILPKLESTSDMSFALCEQLSSVSFGSSLQTIDGGTFNQCKALTSIIIPDRVTTIGGLAFYKCYNLASVTLGKNVRSIGQFAFQGAFKNATDAKIVVKGSAPTIDETTFQSVNKGDVALKIPKEYADSYRNNSEWSGFYLQAFPKSGTNPKWEISIDGTLTLYENTPDYETANDAPWSYYKDCFDKVVTTSDVTYIGQFSFIDYSNIKSVSLPNVEELGMDAFANCRNLTSVFLGNSLRTISSGVFFDCRDLPSIVIPDNVTSIGQHAFGNCKSLNSITLGKSVNSIGEYAFMSCYHDGNGTKNIYVSGYVPVTPDNAFDDVTCGNVNLYVPSELAARYKSHSVWKNFKFADTSSDSRKIVNRIVATSDVASFAVEGNTVAGSIPTFTVTEGDPAYFNSNMSNGRWQKKEGDTWVTSQSGVNPTFTLGTWRFSCQVRIDGNAGSTHVLAKDAEIYVDGERWAETTYPMQQPTYSYINVYSPEITVSPRIDPTGITLFQSTVYLYSKGETAQLLYTITPSDATERDVTWLSTDTLVATVSPTGLVTAKGRGKCYINAFTSNGKTDDCQIIADIKPKGDVNNDGDINSADVVKIYDVIINGIPFGTTRDFFDVNDDGEISSADVVKIYDIIINGVPPIPVDPEPIIIN